MKRLLLLIIFLIGGCGMSAPEVSVVYQESSDAEEKTAVQWLRGSGRIELTAKFISETFSLSAPINIEFGQGHVPFSDFNDKTIFIPFSFIKDIKNTFAGAQKTDLDKAAMDVVIHTILHELGHMLIVMHDIPVVGREEDAVDALSTTLLLRFYEKGDETVINTAEYYGLEKEDFKNLRKWDFMGEHSLNLQRYYQIMCHVYGSDPKKYASLRRTVGLPKARAELCIDEFDHVSKSWLILLNPYLK